MNPIEAGHLATRTIQCFTEADGSLSNFPGLLKKVIREEVWKRRLDHGRVFELPNLRALITEKPIKGWGQDPTKIEAVIRDDPEALVMFREAMKEQGKRTDLVDNVTEVPTAKGNSRAYTLTRLQKQRPDLFSKVKAGDMSANAAAIQAGFRKQRTAMEWIDYWWGKATDSERQQFLARVGKR